MYCPNCGVENSKGQKFCRRCGANLLAVDVAREFINEVAAGNLTNQQNQPNVPAVLKITALVSILGFLFVTAGATALTIIQYASENHGPPLGIFLAFAGYTALVLICRQLLKLATLATTTTQTGTRSWPLQAAMPPTVAPHTPPALHSQTNRNLAEASGYHSVTESETQQFDPARRAGQ